MASAEVGTKRSFAAMNDDSAARRASAHNHEAFASRLSITMLADAAGRISSSALYAFKLTGRSLQKLKCAFHSTRNAGTSGTSGTRSTTQ
jgi:hypothetical protein